MGTITQEEPQQQQDDEEDEDEEILACSFCKKDFKSSLLADFSSRKLCAGCMKLILNRMKQKEKYENNDIMTWNIHFCFIFFICTNQTF